MTRYRGRFAPSPTGPLHLGSLLAAVASWADARAAGGQWLVRIEDIDPPREQPGASAAILELLSTIGLDSDEPVLWQSRRSAAYDAALAQLLSAGLAFECRCSRSDLAAAGGIHRGAWRQLRVFIDPWLARRRGGLASRQGLCVAAFVWVGRSGNRSPRSLDIGLVSCGDQQRNATHREAPRPA